MMSQRAQDVISSPAAAVLAAKAGGPAKADGAFRTIGEVAESLGVPQHVLRFWETKFSQIRPLKRGGQRRYYRPEDVALLARIQDLLHAQGYTIKGVQKIFREGGKAALLAQVEAPLQPVAANNGAPAPAPLAPPAVPAAQGLSVAQRVALAAVLAEIRALRAAIAG